MKTQIIVHKSSLPNRNMCEISFQMLTFTTFCATVRTERGMVGVVGLEPT